MGITKQIYLEGHGKWLSNDICLWRYVPLRTLFFYLDRNIFIPSIAKLQQDDPFEGKVPLRSSWFNSAIQDHYGKRNVVKLEEWLYQTRCDKNQQKQIDLNKNEESFAERKAVILMTHYFEFIRNTRYAWCWFLGSESAAMWSVYGNQGVAIATTIGRLRQIFEKAHRNAAFGRMLYVDVSFDPVDELNDHQQFILQPHFMKRKEYESENEVRFIASFPVHSVRN